MLLYRVTWADPDRWEGTTQTSGLHPLHVRLHLQGRGRFDNPRHYAALYLARTPEAAVGETYGGWPAWTQSMFTRPKDGLVRVLATCEIEDEHRLADLDDCFVLDPLALRPSDVVRRNPDLTQEVALRLWAERGRSGQHGIAWWSYWRAEWRPAMLWSASLRASRWFPQVTAVAVEPLSLDHPAITVAAEVLPRHLDRTGG